MKLRKSNKKKYAAKKSSLKAQKVKDTDPEWSAHECVMSFTSTNTNKWWNIFKVRYYDYIDPDANTVKWFDNTDNNEVELVDTRIHLITSVGKSISITIYFTTNNIDINTIQYRRRRVHKNSQLCSLLITFIHVM